MMSQTNQNDNVNENDNALAAWEEWKEKCFVILVSSDGEYGDLRAILRKLIYSSFKRKFTAICPMQAGDIMKDQYREKKADGNNSGQNIKEFVDNYWSTEFDEGIIRTKPPKEFMEKLQQETGKAAELIKCYKDFVWYPVRDAGCDPNLKLTWIQGKLIGKKSAINGIAERYLRNYHNDIWFQYNQHRSRGSMNSASEEEKESAKKRRDERALKLTSIDEPVKNNKDSEENTTQIERIPVNDPLFDLENIRDLEKELQDFEWQEIAIILAKMAKLTTDPVTQQFIGWGHSKISKYWKEIKTNENGEMEKTGLFYKCLNYTELFKDTRTVYLMIKRIKAEKNSEAFLSKVKEALELKIKRMEKGENE